MLRPWFEKWEKSTGHELRMRLVENGGIRMEMKG